LAGWGAGSRVAGCWVDFERIVVAIVLMATGVGLVLWLVSGCGMSRVDGACTYTREVATSYVCEPGGRVEHWKVESQQ